MTVPSPSITTEHDDSSVGGSSSHFSLGYNTDAFNLDDIAADSPSTSTTHSKYRSHRRGSIAADFGDDDDMQDELDRLNVAQIELQRELLNVMHMVETMPEDDEDGDISQISSTGTLEIVEEQPRNVTKKRNAENFAKGFFRMRTRRESLQEQTEKQMRRFKQELKHIEPDMAAVVDCQQATQAEIIRTKQEQEGKKLKKEQALQALLQKKTKSLEEEKERQLEILKWNLQNLEPGLEEVMQAQHETQQGMIAKKEQELEETKAVVQSKLQELDLKGDHQESKFWSAPREQLERMMGRKRENYESQRDPNSKN